jgi:hypothetical protein
MQLAEAGAEGPVDAPQLVAGDEGPGLGELDALPGSAGDLVAGVDLVSAGGTSRCSASGRG